MRKIASSSCNVYDSTFLERVEKKRERERERESKKERLLTLLCIGPFVYWSLALGKFVSVIAYA